MSKSPSRLLEKAIRVPSGDQRGLKSRAGSVVTWTTALPSGSIVYTSKSPVSVRIVNAIRPFAPAKVAPAPPAASAASSEAKRTAKTMRVKFITLLSARPPEHNVDVPVRLEGRGGRGQSDRQGRPGGDQAERDGREEVLRLAPAAGELRPRHA